MIGAISVTVVSFNTRDLLHACLSSIFASRLADRDLQVIVVDNASKDGSADMVATDFPRAHLIRSEQNLGFAAGHNRAIATARGEYILVLNSDVIVEPDALETMAAFLGSHGPSIACVGPAVRHPDGSLATSARRVKRSTPAMMAAEVNRVIGVPGWDRATRALRFMPGAGKVHDNFTPATSTPRPAGYIDGMAAMFRRTALTRTGLFDEQFFFDCEIVDLGIRLAMNGFEQWYVPDAVVEHVGGASREKNPIVAEFTNNSKIRLYAKHYPEQFRLLRAWTLTLFALRETASSLVPSLKEQSDDALSHTSRLKQDILDYRNPRKAIHDNRTRWLDDDSRSGD